MKHLLSLALLVCLGTFAHAQIPSYVPTNGLVGWWPFNGNANDESGNGNHGTVNGATLAADRNGNAGKAYSFDGVDDKIDIIANSNFDFEDFSVSCWINSNNKLYTEAVICKSDWNNARSETFALTLNSGSYLTHIKNYSNCIPGAGWVSRQTSSQNKNNNNVWTNILITYGNSALNVYKNGKLILMDTLSKKLDVCNGGQLKFGAAWVQYPDFFNGLLDDIAIYNRALTAAEVQQLYLGACKKPTFTTQSQNKSVAQGQSTTFAVQVDTTSTFQWQMNLGLGAGWVNIPQSSLFSGDTTATLSVQGRSTIDGAQFRCIATFCRADTSNAATLTVTSNASTIGSVAGVPGKINYQGAAVDSAGKPMKNQTIALKLSVLDSSSSGAAAYVETHSTPTNGSGLFSLQIGGGTAVTGTFDSIPWANGRNKYLKTEVNQNGTWVNLGTSQLVSVPYALHAGSAENAKNASFANQAATLRDSLGNAYQIKTVNGQPTLVSAPGNVSTPGTFACGQSVSYAGENYPTVQIGTQCWFQKNVNAGAMVQGANDQTNNGILEKYCYNNDTANCSIYGGLYQWAEAVQYQNGASNTASPSPAFTGSVQGICPTGWHVPSDGEFCTLTTFLDSTVNCNATGWNGTDAGGKMKSTSGLWNSPNTGATNSSGFSVVPGGYRYTYGVFHGIGNDTHIWSCSESNFTDAFTRYFGSGNSNFFRTNVNKSHGFSARCIKD